MILSIRAAQKPPSIVTVDEAIKKADSYALSYTADFLGIPESNVVKNAVPPIYKQAPDGTIVACPWEPENGIILGSDEGLFAFPRIVGRAQGVTIIPGVQLAFQTAALALAANDRASPELRTELEKYMLRLRFDMAANPLWGQTSPNKVIHNTLQKRVIWHAMMGIKDAGKAVDRREWETEVDHTLNLEAALVKLKAGHAKALKHDPALMQVSENDLSVDAVVAMSRNTFFVLHAMPDARAVVSSQFSLDFCKNSVPTLQTWDRTTGSVGDRREGEGEAYEVHANRKLSEEECRAIITKSMKRMWRSIESQYEQERFPVLETPYNKAEYARMHVAREDVARGYKIPRNVRTDQFATYPLLRRLGEIFEGNDKGLVALPSPEEIAAYGGLDRASIIGMRTPTPAAVNSRLMSELIAA